MKSPAYGKVRILLREGVIQDFEQIAVDIQKKTLAKDMGMHPRTLNSRLRDSGNWKVAELARLSDLVEMDHQFLLNLADRLRKKKGKK